MESITLEQLKSQIVKELLKDDPVIKKVIRDMVIQEINATKRNLIQMTPKTLTVLIHITRLMSLMSLRSLKN